MTTTRKSVTFTAQLPDETALEIRLSKKLTDAELEAVCRENPELQLEVEPDGTLIVMPPVNLDSGWYEGEVFAELRNFAKKDGRGQAFSPSTGFRLPDGSTRSADASWVSFEQLNRLSARQRKTFARVVPEFVIEVRSESDALIRLQHKMMDTWIANGVKLAWLIDPLQRKAYVYRADGSVHVEHSWDAVLNGGDVLPGFTLDLRTLGELS